MKRTLATADLHLSDQPVNAYRLDFVKRQLPKIIQYRNIDRLIIAGDLTEQKDRHSAWLTHHVVDVLSDLANLVEVVMIEGNHDFLDIDYPFFRFLEKLNVRHRIRWIRQPTVLDDMLLLPHTSDYQRDWAKLPKARMIVTHNTFEGALSERGGKLKGIPLSALPKVPILSGDVHQPQDIGRLTYIGPPYTVYFGDEFEPRMIMLGDRGSVISLDTKAPRKKILELKYPWKASDFSRIQKSDIVKIRIAISQQDTPRWNEIRDDVKEAIASKGCHIFAVQPTVQNTRSTNTSKDRSSHSKSDSQLIKEYCSRRNASPTITNAGISFATSVKE